MEFLSAGWEGDPFAADHLFEEPSRYIDWYEVCNRWHRLIWIGAKEGCGEYLHFCLNHSWAIRKLDFDQADPRSR